jgi:excisionase family DNA binding protein
MSKDLRPPRTYQDLMVVTGLGRNAVKAAIQTGELPGYKTGSRYVVPADAFDAFCQGTWVPKPRPLFAEPVKPINVSMLHQRKEAQS